MTVSGKHFHQTTVNPTSPESDSASVQAFICVIISIMSHVMKIYFNKGQFLIQKILYKNIRGKFREKLI